MWVFTKYGFFSAVCARQGDGSHGQPVDPDRIMIRVRLRSHLEALKQRFSGLLAECEIREFPETDYAFRLFVPKTDWQQILAELAAVRRQASARTSKPFSTNKPDEAACSAPNDQAPCPARAAAIIG